MSETDGENSFVETKINEFKNRLFEYEKYLGFSVKTDNNEATKFLTITKSELEKMSSEDCGYAAYELTQYVIYLQKTINYEEAIVNWCDSAIDFVISKKLSQYNAYYFQEKRMLAINDNEFAKAAMKARVLAKSRVDSMNFITNKVQDLAKLLINLQQSKKANKYG